MRRSVPIGRALALLLLFRCATLNAEQPRGDLNWPQFRGPAASGVVESGALPTSWSVGESRAVRWKTPVPGLGHSSPIIWSDRLYVTTAVAEQANPELKVGLYGSGDSAADASEQRWFLYCLDKESGKVAWQRLGHQAVPKVARHTKATHCNSTPATDGRFIITFFGSEGLFCFDMDGRLIWRKDLGRLEGGPLEADNMEWGFASSPVIHKGRAFVQCDVHDQSFVAAFELADGREVWRTPRQEVPTWSTPTVYQNGDGVGLAVNGYKQIGGYDLMTGKELWRLGGGGDVPVPTPVSGHGLIYITNAHGASAPLYAVRPTARGDVTPGKDASANDYVAWSTPRNGAYMQTPLVYGKELYSCSDRGVLKCYDAVTGELRYTERLGSGSAGFTASPVAGDGKVYFTSEEGQVFVIHAGRRFQVLAENDMGEICMASPAISEGVIFYRTKGHVVAVGDRDRVDGM